MPSVSVGQLVRAAELRSYFPTVSVLQSDAAISSSDVLTEAPGLTVLVEPNTRYALEGYLAFNSDTTAHIRVGLAAPPGATGHWGLHAMYYVPADTFNAYATQAYGIDNFITASGGSAGQACAPFGVLQTSGAGGMLRTRLAQAVATATPTALKAGSWLRLTRL